MNKYISIFLLTLILITSSCNLPSSGKIDKEKLETNITEVITDKIQEGDLKYQEVVISNKIIWFLAPLFFALFSSIIIIFLGARLIGLGVLVSSITCIVLLIMLSMYIKIVAFIGVIVLLIAIYFLGKEIYNQSIIKRDLVNSVEVSKNLIPNGGKEKLAKILDRIQSLTTRKVVSRIKK